jgi:1,4-alpha-glucan branching enzyme
MNTMTTRSSTNKRQFVPSGRTRTQTIRIEFSDSQAETVAIAGTFNDWRPEVTPMLAVDRGRWIKDLALPPGTYEYCLVVDRCKWVPDPQARETIPNPFGGRNSVLKVPQTTPLY